MSAVAQASTVKPLVAWSYSVLSMFENCPRKYWAVRRQKLVTDGNAASFAGDREHDHFQQFLKKGLALPPELKPFQPLLDKLKAAPGQMYVEFPMTLDLNFVPCGFKDWNRAWVRGAADVVIVNGSTAYYFDWKSGKFRDNDDQIELTALLIFKHFPDVTKVVAGLIFYKHNKSHPHIVHKADEARLWNGFLARVRVLEDAVKADLFPPEPNPLCGWCPYGACQYNTNKKLLPQGA